MCGSNEFQVIFYAEKFHPLGESPWTHLLCCGMLAVGRLQLRIPRLASAPKSTREISGTGFPSINENFWIGNVFVWR